MAINKKKENKNYVYSIRITKAQKDLLKKNEWIKKQLNEHVREFFKLYEA